MKKKITLTVAMIAITWIILEVIASAFLFHYYKEFIPEMSKERESSVMLLIRKMHVRHVLKINKITTLTKSEPSPLYVYDSVHGYTIKPGVYKQTYMKWDYPKSKPFTFKITILEDGSRFVGTRELEKGAGKTNIQIYGDSHIFGEGVNDEQTFAYLLQQKHPNTHVRLFAIGGYSLSNAYIDFQKIKFKLTEKDIVILGYGDYYRRRHVASPKRLKEYGKKMAHFSSSPKHVRVELDDSGNLKFGLVPLFCEDSVQYCEQKEPEEDYMNRVSAKLINEIAKNTRAKVYLLFISGSKSDPLLKMLDPSITVVSGLSEDIDYEFQDVIMDYDKHPGPYWHYTMFSQIHDQISKHLYKK